MKKKNGYTKSSSTATACMRASTAARFFFSSRRRHTRFDCDWSSDVCSSDLVEPLHAHSPRKEHRRFDEHWNHSGGKATTRVRVGPRISAAGARSEERRVGKECRCRWEP